MEYNEVYRWSECAAHVDWFVWHGPFWVKKNKTIIGFKKEFSSCQGAYTWFFFFLKYDISFIAIPCLWDATQVNEGFKIRIEMVLEKVSSHLHSGINSIKFSPWIRNCRGSSCWDPIMTIAHPSGGRSELRELAEKHRETHPPTKLFNVQCLWWEHFFDSVKSVSFCP